MVSESFNKKEYQNLDLKFKICRYDVEAEDAEKIHPIPF